MRSLLLINILLVSNILYAQDDRLSKDKVDKIQTVIHLFKTKNIKGIFCNCQLSVQNLK